MKVGDSFINRGQEYECLDRFEHEFPAKWVWIYKLRTICPDCGQRFECTATKTQRKNNLMPRRCQRCQAPGRPVVRKAEKVMREDSSMNCGNQTLGNCALARGYVLATRCGRGNAITTGMKERFCL